MNGLPDECEIAVGSSADCNSNDVPDECDLSADVSYASSELKPLGGGFPQTHVLNWPPMAVGPVTLAFEAYGDINFSTEFVDVYVNGLWLDAVFDDDVVTNDCPTAGPDLDQIILTASEFKRRHHVWRRHGRDPDGADRQTLIRIPVRRRPGFQLQPHTRARP